MNIFMEISMQEFVDMYNAETVAQCPSLLQEFADVVTKKFPHTRTEHYGDRVEIKVSLPNLNRVNIIYNKVTGIYTVNRYMLTDKGGTNELFKTTDVLECIKKTLDYLPA